MVGSPVSAVSERPRRPPTVRHRSRFRGGGKGRTHRHNRAVRRAPADELHQGVSPASRRSGDLSQQLLVLTRRQRRTPGRREPAFRRATRLAVPPVVRTQRIRVSSPGRQRQTGQKRLERIAKGQFLARLQQHLTAPATTPDRRGRFSTTFQLRSTARPSTSLRRGPCSGSRFWTGRGPPTLPAGRPRHCRWPAGAAGRQRTNSVRSSSVRRIQPTVGAAQQLSRRQAVRNFDFAINGGGASLVLSRPATLKFERRATQGRQVPQKAIHGLCIPIRCLKI